MNPTLARALIASVPAGLLFAGSVSLAHRHKTASSLIILVGAACFVLVVATHICEGLQLLPWMGWGQEHSAGHYLDLLSAVLAMALIPIGFLIRAVTSHWR